MWTLLKYLDILKLGWSNVLQSLSCEVIVLGLHAVACG